MHKVNLVSMGTHNPKRGKEQAIVTQLGMNDPMVFELTIYADRGTPEAADLMKLLKRGPELSIEVN